MFFLLKQQLHQHGIMVFPAIIQPVFNLGRFLIAHALEKVDGCLVLDVGEDEELMLDEGLEAESEIMSDLEEVLATDDGE